MLHPLEHIGDHQNPLADTPTLVSCQAPQLSRPRFVAEKVCRHPPPPKHSTLAYQLYHIWGSPEAGISRSVISASFSPVEAFISGLFFTALNTKALGRLCCDETFLVYAAKNERKAAFKERLDRIVRFASGGTTDGGSEPFESYIEIRRYRDAVHHITSFARKDLAQVSGSFPCMRSNPTLPPFAYRYRWTVFSRFRTGSAAMWEEA